MFSYGNFSNFIPLFPKIGQCSLVPQNPWETLSGEGQVLTGQEASLVGQNMFFHHLFMQSGICDPVIKSKHSIIKT